MAVYIPGFIELTLKHSDNKRRRTSVQVSLITDFFETNDGYVMICISSPNTFIVNETYDEVRSLIQASLLA